MNMDTVGHKENLFHSGMIVDTERKRSAEDWKKRIIGNTLRAGGVNYGDR